MFKANLSAKIYLIMLLAMTLWGLSWPSAKIVGQYADPQQVIFWRFIFAAITIVLIAFLLKIKIKWPKQNFLLILTSSTLLISYNYAYLKGTQIGLAGLGGVIVPTISPLITYLLVCLFFNKKIETREFLGISLGLLGGATLFNFWNIDINQLVVSGNLYFILAALTWSFVTILTRRSKKNLNAITYSFWIYSFASILSLAFIPKASFFSIFNYDYIFWINFLIISVGALGLGTSAFFIITMKIGPEKSSSFMYIVPLIAVVSSLIILKEPLSFSIIIGGILSIGALYLINTAKKS